ncbi:MAG: signal peptide peptidase SppA [Bacteroidales bacterium]|nr:signal peptide peptidase SppA [Bacteroidales bacterium]
MKEFVRTTLAVMAGLFLMGIIGMFFFLTFLGALTIAGTQAKPIPKHGVLRIDMADFILSEQSRPSDMLSSLQGGVTETVGLWDAVNAINKASEDPAIEYIYLKTDGALADNAGVEELRKALSNFRLSGKAVISYIENPTTGTYYLATVADKVYMTAAHGGNAMITGISGQLIFLKDLLDKLGVNVQLIRHGKYKSAGEMFVKSEASPANLEQNKAMVESLWNSISEEICKSREISRESLDSMIDNLSLNLPEDFLENKLVDELLTFDQLKERLTSFAVAEKFDDIDFIQFADYVKAVKANDIKAADKSIAVIYANGEIVDGEYDYTNITGNYFAEQIAKVRADSTVKAVVLRVNSPGGSVLASEKIRNEIDLLRKVKPVIASYGSAAASGGYWISNGCDKIYTDAMTLTGSIGVFGMIPDFSKTAKNLLHVNVTAVNSHDHSDMFGLMRPFDAVETAYMQRSIEDIYSRFVNLVADGRSLDPEFVDSIAQGRVWTGADAIGIKLVDEIGTLEDAIHYAAVAGGDGELDNWNIVGYPKEMTVMGSLMAMFGELEEEKTILTDTPFENIGTAVMDWQKSWKKNQQNTVFARMPYEMVIK